MAKVRQRVLTGSALAAGVLVLLVLNLHAPPGLVPWAGGVVLLGLSAWELGNLGRLGGPALRRALALSSVLVLALSGISLLVSSPPAGGPLVELGALYGVSLLGGILGLGTGRGAGGSASGASIVLLVVWLVPPFALLALFERDHGPAAFGVLLLLSKIGDVFGYFVGRAIGVRHPFPRISPNKTLAGCCASAVAAVLTGLLLGLLGWIPAGSSSWWVGALLGLSINLAAQAGDLFESSLKRRAGVKDSSALVGAAGGVLDVVDSLLLTVPVAVVLWPLFPA